MITYDPKEIPFPQVHRLLLGAIGPRPIALASTIDKEGRNNLAAFSFYNVFSANPPVIIFSPARSGRTLETKDTYENVKEVPEVVVCAVTQDILEQVVTASSPYPRGIDEFVESGLTPIDSDLIRPKRVKESPAQFECKVLEVKELGTGGAAGNLIICEVVKMHFREDIMDKNGNVDQHKIKLIGRMGGLWHSAPNEHSMFQVERLLKEVGIGFSKIPEDIKNSKILTGNDLGKLARILALPDETSVNEYKLLELSDFFVPLRNEPEKLEEALHQHAQKLLKENKLEEAWKTLLAFNND